MRSTHWRGPRQPQHRAFHRALTTMLAIVGVLGLVACTGVIESGGNQEGGGGGDSTGGGDGGGGGDATDTGPGGGDATDTTITVPPDLDEDQYMVTSDPGTRTLQRLNSVEYDNTIQDLLGVDSTPSDDFPTDDRGYGFDNIAQVLSMSPLHVEMYELTAEEVVDEVMYFNTTMPELRYFAADDPDVSASTGGSTSDGWNLWSNGTLTTLVDLPADGRYKISTRARGQQAGNETVQMIFVVDGAVVETVQVPNTSMQGFETEVEIKGGLREIGVGFANDFYDEAAMADRNLVVEGFSVDGPVDFMPVDNPLRSAILTCDPAVDGCAREVLEAFVRRAWRRPPTTAEIDRLLQFIDLAVAEGDDTETGIRLALRAVLLSPHFLFKVEIDADPASPEVHPLTDHELATRLSYFLWRSMPDEELLTLADAGALQERTVLAEQVARMLDDPKAESLVQDFAGQWLWIRAIDEAVPDVWYYPDWNDTLQADMRTEAEMTFRTLYLEEDQSLRNLLIGRETFINERLAAHYGFSGVTGDDFQRFSLEGTDRVGWVTQGALLTSTSYATRTSPVRRGQWVMQNLLCDEPDPPPAGVEGIPEDNPESLTLRERMERHRADPICASCHEVMDEIGFALENYDGIGAYRTEDAGHTINASGQFPDGTSFSGPGELGEVLASDPAFAACLVDKAFIYAIGRGTRPADLPYREAMADAVAGSDYRLSELLTQVATSEPFRMRRGGP